MKRKLYWLLVLMATLLATVSVQAQEGSKEQSMKPMMSDPVILLEDDRPQPKSGTDSKEGEMIMMEPLARCCCGSGSDEKCTTGSCPKGKIAVCTCTDPGAKPSISCTTKIYH